jgi:hypothetical protein
MVAMRRSGGNDRMIGEKRGPNEDKGRGTNEKGRKAKWNDRGCGVDTRERFSRRA